MYCGSIMDSLRVSLSIIKLIAMAISNKESYCSHTGRPLPRPRSRHTALKFYVQVFQNFISRHLLILKHLYLDHKGLVFIP